jgi:hypothetical protein
VADLQATRWTGRPGYPIGAMVGMTLVKSLYVLPTWTRTVALVAEHAALRKAIGGTPSADACYRFTRKLRRHKEVLDSAIAAVIASLHAETPGLGTNIAIDGSDFRLTPTASGSCSTTARSARSSPTPTLPGATVRPSPPAKGGGFYGYKVHAVVDAASGLPLSWIVASARDAEVPVVPALLDKLAGYGIRPSVCIADKGYDVAPVYAACESRDIRPVVPLRETPFVKAGKAAPPKCEHGVWTFAGSDAKRHAAKYRCSTGECSPASVWIKADRLHTLIPGRRTAGRRSTAPVPASSVSSAG